MRRSRWVAIPILAVLGILLAGACSAAQAPGASAAGAKGGKPLDDEPIIVKPKGGGVETDKPGLQWLDEEGRELKPGKEKEFRADLFQALKTLQACEKDKTCVKAYAVRFNLYSALFEVRTKDSGYEWDIPARHKQKACEFGKSCTEGGIPPEFMKAEVEGKIEAKFDAKSEWVEVVEVRFNVK